MSKKVENREELLHVREEELLEAIEDINRREAAVLSIELTIARKDRSLARPLASVEKRRNVGKTLRGLDAEREIGNSLDHDIKLSEGVLQNRDLQCSARFKKANCSRGRRSWQHAPTVTSEPSSCATDS